MLPDAIVLQASGETRTFYALVTPEDPLDQGWEAMELTSEGYFTFDKEVPFRLVLFFLSQSTGGMTTGGRGVRGEPERATIKPARGVRGEPERA